MAKFLITLDDSAGRPMHAITDEDYDLYRFLAYRVIDQGLKESKIADKIQVYALG